MQSGDYSVKFEDIDGGRFESANISFVGTGIDQKHAKTYKVYLNPSVGIYNFSSEALSEVTVADGLGRTVLKKKKVYCNWISLLYHKDFTN